MNYRAIASFNDNGKYTTVYMNEWTPLLEEFLSSRINGMVDVPDRVLKLGCYVALEVNSDGFEIYTTSVTLYDIFMKCRYRVTTDTRLFIVKLTRSGRIDMRFKPREFLVL